MELYYYVKIPVLIFSRCGDFEGGGEEFYSYYFFFSLFWIICKGREAEEINLCLLFVISAVFSDH